MYAIEVNTLFRHINTKLHRAENNCNSSQTLFVPPPLPPTISGTDIKSRRLDYGKLNRKLG